MEEKEEGKKATEGDEEGLDIVISTSRETLAARRALPFSQGVVADRRRCGPITRCHGEREVIRRRVGHEGARAFSLKVKKKKRPKVWTEFDRKIRADESWEKSVIM